MDICNTMSRKLPIGIQSFEKLRTGGYLYVDKTELVYRLAKAGIPCFLSRPRRFGKSLLLSTLEAYFLGKKDLFKGLAIERLEQDWLVYPVLHLDLNAEKYDSNERLANLLESQLEAWEAEYGVTEINRSYSIRFMTVIRRAYEQTGRRVVVLVDEYDKPMLRSFDNPELQRDFRETLTAFYTVLKSADAYLQLVFITGVTKFAQMGIFSNLNQLQDISLHPAYTTLCGMTRAEIEAVFAPELQSLARGNGLTYEETMDKLGRQYDGYHFNYRNWEGMFNPFSVLNTFSTGLFENAWFASGTPTFLAEMLRKTDFDLRDLDGIEVSSASLSDDCADIHNPVPMIYQSGYLTIKDYDKRFGIYYLGFPNREVEEGFIKYLIPFYTSIDEGKTAFYITEFVHDVEEGNYEDFFIRLQSLFADTPYELIRDLELHYQNVLFIVSKLLGFYVQAEYHTSDGRIDLTVQTDKYIYVMEFKFDGSAEEALQQIEEKRYILPFAKDNRKIVKAGVNFSSKTRNIEKWLVKEVE